MQALEWTNIDKSRWPRGPWDDEPDKEQWLDEDTGLPCLIVRHTRLGHLCGYVGVGKAHPLHGKSYSEWDAEVHGGLTFASECSPESDPGLGVCHLTEPGDEDPVWWFGFDFAHCFDLSPATSRSYSDSTEVYRAVPYVKSECAKLAKQLVEV